MSQAELQRIDWGCKRLGVDRARFYSLTRENILPAGVVVRLGRHLRVNPEKLEEFIANGGRALPGGWKREAGGAA